MTDPLTRHGTHPETRSGEIFLGWFPAPSKSQVLWSTRRFGTPRAGKCHQEYPLFIQRSEWDNQPGRRRTA